jgi:hypothetical protein
METSSDLRNKVIDASVMLSIELKREPADTEPLRLSLSARTGLLGLLWS